MPIACACGHTNPDEGLYCQACGLPLTNEETRPGVDPPEDALVGHHILGTYELVQLIGQGGMSLVYRGRHLLTDQAVAVKVLPPELATNREVKARFIEEARTLARLEHPNIVALHNFVEEDGHLYLVMQFAEGDSFDQIIAREGRVDVADVVAVGIDVARALEYAHEQGVIHRDIKPSNIVIRADGSVKVMDFGIAKIVGSSRLTQTGQTMGTVRYMSPEQVRGKLIDQTTDIYSLGVTLYEALTGRTPFDGDTHYDIMRKHLTEAPQTPSELRALPPGLDEILLRAMAKRPQQRYANAKDFRRALQGVPIDQSARRLTRSVPVAALTAAQLAADEAAVPGRRRSNVSLPLVIAIVLLVGAAGAVVWAMLDSDPSGTPGRREGTAAGPPTKGSAMGMSWPALHDVARTLSWRTERLFDDLALHIHAVNDVDVSTLAGRYRRARATFAEFLKEEGLRLQVAFRPLHLVVVPPKLLADPKHWPGAKVGKDYPVRYNAVGATLYVHDGRGFADTDLLYGFGLHFCSPTNLSDQRCVELAEGFERFLKKRL